MRFSSFLSILLFAVTAPSANAYFPTSPKCLHLFQTLEEVSLPEIAPARADALRARFSLRPLPPSEELIALVSETFGLDRIYAADSGVIPPFTLFEHTRRVLEVFREQERFFPMAIGPSAVPPGLFPVILVLHDVGKPLAVRYARKSLQHEFTLPIATKVLSELGFGKKEITLARSLMEHDWIGRAVMGKVSVADAAIALKGLAARNGIPPADFFALQKLFFFSDAGSYPLLLAKDFTIGSEGRLVHRNSVLDQIETEVAR